MIRSQRAREAAARPAPGYLEAQAAAGGALTPQMRMIVVGWMAEACDEFRLQPETLHLAVALLDRFLSTAAPQGVPRGVLQLVAVACIMVASKHLEVSHPSVEQLTAVAAHCFGAQDLLRMERVLLDALGFEVANVTSFGFLHLYAQGLAAQPAEGGAGAAGLPAPVAALAVYLLDLALLDYALLAFAPSELAAAALALAAQTHARECADEAAGAPPALAPRLLALAGLDGARVARCAECLLALHRNAAAPATPAVRDLLAPLAAKYGQPAWCCAALARPLEALDARRLLGGAGELL